jgi:hypothetical protein
MGMYDEDRAAVTVGDLADTVYWQTKFARLKLEAALLSRQPDHAVRGLTADVAAGAADVLRSFPNHADVAAWRDEAAAAAEALDPAALPADFRPDFAHWTNHAYEDGWRAYHLAKMAAADQDVRVCLVHAREAVTQLTRAAARMAGWPVDVRQFVMLALPEMAKLADQVRSRLSA